MTSIAASFRNMWGIVLEAADGSRGKNADARYAAMFEAASNAQLWLTTKATLGALMKTCATKDAEITRLQSELNTALERVKELEDGMTKLIIASQMLLQNAEGCAVNHYGNDFQEFGPPGWLVDCENDIVSARALLQSSGGK